MLSDKEYKWNPTTVKSYLFCETNELHSKLDLSPYSVNSRLFGRTKNFELLIFWWPRKSFQLQNIVKFPGDNARPARLKNETKNFRLINVWIEIERPSRDMFC